MEQKKRQSKKVVICNPTTVVWKSIQLFKIQSPDLNFRDENYSTNNIALLPPKYA